MATSTLQPRAAAARNPLPASRKSGRHGTFRLAALLGLFLVLALATAQGQTNAPAPVSTSLGPLSISLGPSNGAGDVDSGIKILFLITLLSLAPSILLLMTCFTRVAIVLGFVARAQIRSSGGQQKGDGLAIAGIIIGFAWVAFYVLLVIVGAISHNSNTSVIDLAGVLGHIA